MDDQETSPAPTPGQWVSLGEAVERVRSGQSRWRSREIIKHWLLKWVDDGTIQGRDPESGRNKWFKPLAAYRRNERLPALELHLAELDHEIDELRNEQLGRVAAAVPADGLENAGSAAAGIKPAGKRGRPILDQIPATMVLVGIRLCHEGEVLQAEVEKWIMNEMSARGKPPAESTARQYARVALGTYRNWKTSLGGN